VVTGQSGGKDYKAQNNTQTIFTDPDSVTRFQTELIAERTTAQAQNNAPALRTQRKLPVSPPKQGHRPEFFERHAQRMHTRMWHRVGAELLQPAASFVAPQIILRGRRQFGEQRTCGGRRSNRDHDLLEARQCRYWLISFPMGRHSEPAYLSCGRILS
jgi:hypothetical protein